MRKQILILLALISLNFTITSCNNAPGDDYSLVYYSNVCLDNKYEPLFYNKSGYTYSMIKEYFPDLPFLIPGDYIKINLDRNNKPKSYDLIKAQIVEIEGEYQGCTASSNEFTCTPGQTNVYYIKNTKEKYYEKYWGDFDTDRTYISTDLNLKYYEYNSVFPMNCVFTYSKYRKHVDKYIVESVWDKAVFDEYVK